MGVIIYMYDIILSIVWKLLTPDSSCSVLAHRLRPCFGVCNLTTVCLIIYHLAIFSFVSILVVRVLSDERYNVFKTQSSKYQINGINDEGDMSHS